jgi:hypothetical protein
MDPVSLTMLMKALPEALVALAFTALPIGIIWVRHVHKVRMRELDLEEKMLPRHVEARLAAIEERLGGIERALSAPAPDPLQRRAGLLEGPASSGSAEPEAAARVRAPER